MNSSRSFCGKCGSPLPGNAPEGFCPHCAFTGALDSAPAPSPTAGTIETIGTPAGAIPGSAVHYFGDYELLQEIGRGGMGVVYRARQISLNRVVAVKMLLHGRFSEEVFVKRFHLEAEAAAHLDHPNIVPIYEVGKHEGQHYFSMKLIEGESLAQQLARGKWEKAEGLENPERSVRNQQIAIANMLAKLARAVHYAHQRGVLHRDLKPHNILVDAQGEPHLTDFGLAKLIQQDTGLTVSQAVMGSPAYMSPEQASGKIRDLSTATDIYGLGAVLYTLLTGRAPFEAETALETMRKVVEEQPMRPRVLRPGLGRDLETICLKCLAKAQAKRYASAEALAEDLESWQENKPIRIRPVSGLERFQLWCRRKPVVASLAATSLLIFLLGLAGVLWQWRRAEEQSRQRQQALARAEEQSAQRQQALARAQKERYAANVAVAQNLMQQGQYRQARELLDDPAMFPHQGWEWGWLQSKCDRDLITISSPSIAYYVAFAPDSKGLLTSGADGVVRLWDPTTGGLLREFRGHSGPASFSAGAFHPQGTRMVTFGWDNPCTTRTWDFNSGRALLVWTNSALVNCCQLSPDGRYVATAGEDRKVSVWDFSTGQLVRQADYGDNVFTLAFSPDGKRIAFGGGARWLWQGVHDTTVRIWEWQTDRQQVLVGHDKSLVCVAFSPDGRTLASSSIGALRLWDVATGTSRLALQPAGASDPLFCLAFSPVEGNLLAIGGGKRMNASAQVLDTVSGVPVLQLQGHSEVVRGIAFSPDGSRIATTAFDGKVKIWHRRNTTDYLGLEDHGAAVWSVACSRDGRTVATGSLDQTVGIWDAETGELTRSLATGFPVISLALSSNGSRLVTPTAKATATLWDLTNARPLRTLSGHTKAVMSVALSQDERWIASASKDKTAMLWSAEQGVLVRRFEGHTDWVLALAFDPDGKRLATGGADSQVILWDVSTGARVMPLAGHEDWVQSVAFSPDGRYLATGSKDKHVRLFDTQTGKAVWSVKGHDDGVTSVAFSPDGERLATAAGTSAMQSTFTRDWSVSIWHRETGYRLFRFEPHLNSVLSVAFSPDGTRLVTGAADHTARIRTAFPWRPESYPGGPADPLANRIENYRRQRGQLLARHLDRALVKPARTNLQAAIGEVNVPSRPILKTTPRLPIPARAEGCTTRQLDLSLVYNAALEETWMPVSELRQVDMSLAALTPGLHTLGGVPFDVRGVVQLRRKAPDWAKWSNFPERISIPVDRRFSRFHVLHGSMFSQGRGSRVGAYRLQYADGTDEPLEIILGRDVEDWSWPPVGHGAILPAWEGEDSANPGRSLRLYARTYVNPHPEREVTAIEFCSMLSNAGPFLVALTTE